MMSEIDFIKKMVGVKWVDRSCTFDAADCWGLVVLYYRHVLGIELHHAEGYESGDDFITCHEGVGWQWSVTESKQSGCMVTFYQSGNPSHVGIYLSNGKILHSRGEGGCVRVDNLTAIMRIYNKVEFRTYAKI